MLRLDLIHGDVQDVAADALLLPVDGALCRLGGASASALRAALPADEREDELGYVSEELARLRPLAERLITFAKRGDLHARRRVLSVISDKGVVHELFTEIAPLVAEREGGYTRITKTGYRKGDNAPMAVIELVLEPVVKKPASSKKSAARVETPKSAPVEETPAEETEVPAEDVVEGSAEAPAEEAAAEAHAEEAAAEESAAEESEAK